MSTLALIMVGLSVYQLLGRLQPSFACTDPIGCVTFGPGATIKLGSIQVLTGPISRLGTVQANAIELALEERGWSLFDHPVELVMVDGECSSESGTASAQVLTSDPQIIGVIGTSCSTSARYASGVLSQAGLVMISGSNTFPELTSVGGQQGSESQPGYFRTVPNDEIQGAAAAEFAFYELGVSRASIVHYDAADPSSVQALAFRRAFEALGGEVVSTDTVAYGDTNMRPVLTSAANAGAELLYFPIYSPEADFVVIQSSESLNRESTVLMSSDGLVFSTIFDTAGERAAGVYATGLALPEGQPYQDFVSRYTSRYDEPPEPGQIEMNVQAWAARAYDATNMLLAAVEQVAIHDRGTIHIGRQAIRDALHSTQDFQGVTGRLTCDQFGDCAEARIAIYLLTDPASGIEGWLSNVMYVYEP